MKDQQQFDPFTIKQKAAKTSTLSLPRTQWFIKNPWLRPQPWSSQRNKLYIQSNMLPINYLIQFKITSTIQLNFSGMRMIRATTPLAHIYRQVYQIPIKYKDKQDSKTIFFLKKKKNNWMNRTQIRIEGKTNHFADKARTRWQRGASWCHLGFRTGKDYCNRRQWAIPICGP